MLSSSLPSPSSLSSGFSDSPSTMTLHIDGSDRAILTGGAPLRGHVSFNLPRARSDGISSVRVKLRGVAKTVVSTYAIHTRAPMRSEKSIFLRADVPLWPSSGVMPPDETGIITLPFEFSLSSALPPSFSGSAEGKSGSVCYCIEAVGERRGFLRSKRRVHVPLMIVPTVPPLLAGVREELLADWDGGWKVLKANKHVRLDSAGAHTEVNAELYVPNLPSFPMSTPIPFRLEVRGNGVEAVIPQPSSITLRADRVLWVKADIVADTVVDHHAPACKFVDQASWSSTPVGGEGAWALNSHFLIEGPPTFKLSNIAVQHRLRIRIPFPGIGNDLVGVFAITVDSGIAAGGVPPPWEPPAEGWCNSVAEGVDVPTTGLLSDSEVLPDYCPR